MTALQPATAPRSTLARIQKGLRMLTVPLPHLAGLAAAVRVDIDARVPTMGVFASGRLVANPDFTARLNDNELVFVLAHELLHLALRTHERAKGSGQLEFNYAHDYIINDMLRAALGVTAIPAGGLDMPGAREKSAEQIVVEMRRNGDFVSSRSRVWEGEVTVAGRVFGPQADGGGAPGTNDSGDVLDDRRERELYPDDAADQAGRAKQIGELAAKGLALGKAMDAMSGARRGRGADSGGARQLVAALRGIYSTPWQMALQTWLEGVVPGERTFARPSRRGADRQDVVLPGRRRHAWMLNVVLDTSGSMSDEIPRALGAIADFCDAASVDDIRLVQCDTQVTSDEVLTPTALAAYEVGGYGGSDLTPAMLALADDPRVTATIIITDGDITYPAEPMPYAVLWILPPHSQPGFTPPYGRVVTMQQEGAGR
ncbi:MAG TPA: VWA-like domain-containing protein [Xanthobacteraceae bacterium]|nr:VWA-like domain-containing protein [Xanthobacteraceae bacterium]